MNQEQLNQRGQQEIAGWARTVKAIWVKMCEELGIPPESKFVVGLEESKLHPFYQQAVQNLQAAQQEYRVGGYVGLRIVNGKAQ